ncbi:MAG: 50S ribosomal protein L21 [Acidimicrobiales bacterium]|nr:50S ribosomal protein L21 [Acidimicrobiales bacterium]
MYAVIDIGSKQSKVAQGDVVNVDLLDQIIGDEVILSPVAVFDGQEAAILPKSLEGASIKVRVLGEVKGPKITGFTYKHKSNQRKKWSHRQNYTQVEILEIVAPNISK